MPSHQQRRTPLPPDYQFPTPKGDGLDEARRVNMHYGRLWPVPLHDGKTGISIRVLREYDIVPTPRYPQADATGEP